MSKINTSKSKSKTIVETNEVDKKDNEEGKVKEQNNVDFIDNEDDDNSILLRKLFWFRNLPITEGCHESPIDINLTLTKKLDLPPIIWMNFEIPPKKTKVTNTGQTIIFSAKWKEERPYIMRGPFIGKYVFSNFHLHWGDTAMVGSEHSMDGCKLPAEMHVVFFKSSYLTQESALKEQDGCATLVYLFKIQDDINSAFQVIIDSLEEISYAGLSKKIDNIVITKLFRIFYDDYFLYWGSVSTEDCIHYVMWLITRQPIGISIDQLDALRFIFDENGEPISRNYREVQCLQDRSVFHVNPSTTLYSTLLPLPESEIVQLYKAEDANN